MFRKSSTPLVLSAILLVAVVLFAAACEWANGRQANTPAPIKIGIVYTQPHPITNAIIAAFKTHVMATFPDAQFIEKHGYGDKTLYPGVVREVISQNVDILVPVTTPLSIEALQQASGRIPVVFLAVTDPLSAGLVESFEHPVKSSGVSDNPPMASVIDLIRAFMPEAKTLGIPYDSTDPPGVLSAERAELAAKARGFEVQRWPVISESELRAAIRGLSAKVDVLVIGMDNLMVKNAGIISETAMDQRKPLFAADDKSVAMGAVAGVGVDYANVGRLGANTVIKVLKDKQSPGSIAVETLQTGGLFVNSKSLAFLNLKIPTEFKERVRDLAQ
jgi:putative tryptophan/tyrosine transport system substrate-binding protein